MIKFKSSYIRTLTKDEILKELSTLNNDLIRERSKKSTGGVSENPKMIHMIKKKIAIIKTVLNN